MTIKEIRAQTGLTQAAFAARYGIPKRSVENWESGVSTPPPYVINLLTQVVKNGEGEATMTYTNKNLIKMLDKLNWAKAGICNMMLTADERNAADALPEVYDIYREQLNAIEADIALVTRLINAPVKDRTATAEESERLYAIYVGYMEA